MVKVTYNTQSEVLSISETSIRSDEMIDNFEIAQSTLSVGSEKKRKIPMKICNNLLNFWQNTKENIGRV